MDKVEIDALDTELSKLYSLEPVHFIKVNKTIEPLRRVATHFLIESYTEREWKELLNYYYLNTTYKFLTEKPGEVFRIHFFNEKEKSYLGFITLKPIPEPLFILSFIYPNFEALIPLWKNYKVLEGLDVEDKIFVMTYDRDVHLQDKKISIKTLAFYAQDDMVLACAHADILMLTKFLNKKWNTPEVRIGDILEGYSFFKLKQIPTKGLNIYQINEIFHANGYTMRYFNIEEQGLSHKDTFFVINSMLESSIPVYLFLKRCNEHTYEYHVVLIIGHTLNEKTGQKKYLIYDDSGALFEWLNKPRTFIGLVSEEELKHFLHSIFIYEPERVYLSSLHILENFNKKHKDVFPKAEEKFNRMLLIHNSKAKAFFKTEKLFVYKIPFHKNKNFEHNDKELIRFIKTNQPHYVWLLEFNFDKRPLYLVADPTKHKDTVFTPFYNFAVATKDKISLLYGG